MLIELVLIIHMMVRCLDFQVYLHNSNLIVASSNTNTEYKYKETINYLELSDVFDDIFELINNYSSDSLNICA